MPPRLKTVAVVLTATILVLALAVIATGLLAALHPPGPRVAPTTHDTTLYYFAVGLVVLSSSAFAVLSLFGLAALQSTKSIFLSIHILGSVILLMLQFVLVIFVATIRPKIHTDLETKWTQACAADPKAPGCQPATEILSGFRHSEHLLALCFAVCVVLQIAQLIAHAILCERLAYVERKNQPPEDDD